MIALGDHVAKIRGRGWKPPARSLWVLAYDSRTSFVAPAHCRSDATAARTTCVGCARMVPMGELRLYAIELGAILRCPSCDEAAVRIARTPRGLWLDLRGATTGGPSKHLGLLAE
jgi:hypothetical protein